MRQILAYSSDKSRIFYLFLGGITGLLLAGSLMSLFSNIFGWNDFSDVWYIRLNAFLQSLFMFFLPAYMVAIWSNAKPFNFLRMDKGKSLLFPIILAIIIFIVSTPFISFLTTWNKQLSLPEGMRSIEVWMRTAEDAALHSSNILLGDKTILGLSINLLLVAAFTAASEELFFRGILQRSLEGALKNGHIAVWLSAIIFSALHLQFFGFFPRLALGALLGYLFLYSRNLWVPIMAHFFNNAMVIITSFWGDATLVKKINTPSLSLNLAIFALISAIAIILLLICYRRITAQSSSSKNSNAL